MPDLGTVYTKLRTPVMHILPDFSVESEVWHDQGMVTKWPYNYSSGVVFNVFCTTFCTGSVGNGPGAKFGQKAAGPDV